MGSTHVPFRKKKVAELIEFHLGQVFRFRAACCLPLLQGNFEDGCDPLLRPERLHLRELDAMNESCRIAIISPAR